MNFRLLSERADGVKPESGNVQAVDFGGGRVADLFHKILRDERGCRSALVLCMDEHGGLQLWLGGQVMTVEETALAALVLNKFATDKAFTNAI